MGILRRNTIHWCRTGEEDRGEILLLAGGHLARLNPVAARVWEELECPGGVETIFRRLRRRYRGVSDVQLAEDLDRLLRQWMQAGWIEVQDDPVFPYTEEPWPV